MGNWGETTLLIGVITPVITGRGAPCTIPQSYAYDQLMSANLSAKIDLDNFQHDFVTLKISD